MACSTPIPSSRSRSYAAMKAPELRSPRSICVASSFVIGAGTSSTLLVLGLYQCIHPPFPFPAGDPISNKPQGVRAYPGIHRAPWIYEHTLRKKERRRAEEDRGLAAER